MANVVMNRFKTQSMDAGIDLTSQPIYCALINSQFALSSTTQIADVQTFSSVQAAWETSGVNYTAGGTALSATSVYEDDVNDKSVFSAANITWPTATVTAYGAFIYRQTDSAAICVVDFGEAKTSTAGDFTIQWNAAGIINLT